MAGILDDLLSKGKAIISGTKNDLKQNLLNRSVEVFRKSKAGQQMELTATKQKVTELLPFIAIAILVIFLFGRRFK